MIAPAYDNGDIVYLRESAAIGHLEPVKISSVTRSGNSWIYSVTSSLTNPRYASHYGDKISMVNSKLMFFTESEFANKCEALQLALRNAERIVQNLTLQLVAVCDADDIDVSQLTLEERVSRLEVAVFGESLS